MKKLILLSILLIVGCEETLEPQDCAGVAGGTAVLSECIIGNWERTFYDESLNVEIKLLFSLKDDGTWTGTAQRLPIIDSGIEADGIYNISDGEMTITNNDCSHEVDNHNGIYNISININELNIILIEDECISFAEWFAGNYSRTM